MTNRSRTGRSTIPTIEVDSWQEYLKITGRSAYQNWAFRGQADAEWPMFSSLSRHFREYNVHPDAWPSQEDRILRIFRRKAHLFLDHVPDESDDFQWLALMQHHGAPTRVIDFTWSPFVALFFALERAKTDAAVWALSPTQIWNEQQKFRVPGRKDPVTVCDLNMRNRGAYRAFYLEKNIPFVVYGEPTVMNKRLVAQSGTFVIPGILNKPVEQILSSYPSPAETAVKFILRTDQIRDEAMHSLYNMNITNATLFPDLDGLAKSMAYELEFHWAFNPKTMKKYPGY